MPQFNISSGLPDLPVGMNDKDAALVGPVYRAITALAQQLSLLTGNVQYSTSEQVTIDQLGSLIDSREQRIYVKAMEDLSYGSLISLVIDGGRLAAWKADATVLTKPAHGICDQPGGILTGNYGVALFMRGRTASVAGTVLGSSYYLSTAGGLQLSSPTADSVLNQIVAVGLGSAGIYLNIELVGQRVSRVYKTGAANLRTQYTYGSFTDASV
jgi:hypothetical protein